MATKTITAAGLTELGDSGSGLVGVKVIQFVSSSFSGTITVQARSKGQAAGTVTAVPIPYKSRYVNGAVGTEAYVTTGITGNSIIEVNAAGLDIVLSTAFASGSMTVYISDAIGR